MTFVLIPARGGSKRLRRKNLALVDGQPLVARAIRLGQEVSDTVRVLTDDPEIRSVAMLCGAEVLEHPMPDDTSTVDEIAVWAWERWQEPFWLVQPTVVGVSSWQLTKLTETQCDVFQRWATLAVLVHGITQSDRVEHERVRQLAEPRRWQEVGVRWYPYDPRGEWGLTSPVRVPCAAVDIDTAADLAAARQLTERRRILFRVIANDRVGSGHLRRCLALATALQHHEIGFDMPDAAPWALEMLEGWNHSKPFMPDLMVVDTLDTGISEMADFRRYCRILTLENRGPGVRFADVVINDLYPVHTRNELTGPDWFVMRPEFSVVPDLERRGILVTFGGTDPAHQTERVAQVLAESWSGIRVVPPPGRGLGSLSMLVDSVAENPSMAYELATAKIVVTSAGRTMWEAARMGTPAVVLAANRREMDHVVSPGALDLGLGATVTDDTLRRAVGMLLEDQTTWEELSEAGKRAVDGRGLERVVWEIERLARGL